MRRLALYIVLLILVACSKDELSYLSILNETGIPIYAQPFTSDFATGDWIQPGNREEFFSIEHDNLDGFAYFAFYYDSLVIFLKNIESDPVKFYKDGTTINYDPALNPFTNREMWNTNRFDRDLPGNSFETLEKKHVEEHFFSISGLSIPFIADTTLKSR